MPLVLAVVTGDLHTALCRLLLLTPGGGLNPWAFAAFVFLLESLSLADTTPHQIAEFLAAVSSGAVPLRPGRIYLFSLRGVWGAPPLVAWSPPSGGWVGVYV